MIVVCTPVDLENSYIDWNVAIKFSPSLILDHKVFPLSEDDASFTFAVSNPTDVWALQKAEQEAKSLKMKYAMKVVFVIVSEKSMEDVLERYKEHIR